MSPLDGYNKTTYKLSYWFSFYDNEDGYLTIIFTATVRWGV